MCNETRLFLTFPTTLTWNDFNIHRLNLWHFQIFFHKACKYKKCGLWKIFFVLSFRHCQLGSLISKTYESFFAYVGQHYSQPYRFIPMKISPNNYVRTNGSKFQQIPCYAKYYIIHCRYCQLGPNYQLWLLIDETVFRCAFGQSGYGDMRTGPHKVLAATLNLFQPGGDIFCPPYADVPT